MAAVRVRNLVKRYQARLGGETVALNGISFEVADGEIYGLIGADGAGKTTAFQILAGVMDATSGEVEVLGMEPRRARDRVGYLTQRFSLYMDLSVEENLQYSAGLKGVRSVDLADRSARFLNAFGLAPFTRRLAGELSGGMRQKLALAAALVSNPRLLLLDEPTTGVDPVSRREFWDTLAELAAEGITIVVATPYLDEAERCHRIALVERGEIRQSDSPAGFRASLGCTRLEVRAADLARAEAALERAPVEDAQRFGDRLDVLVRDFDSGRRAVVAALAAAGIETPEPTPHRPTLESALVATLRRMRGAGERPAFPQRRGKTGPRSELLLGAKGLHKRFGGFTAVRDFSLEIRRGEVYGLLGANGAGKTTAIKMMCGLLAPTRGTVEMLGRRRELRSAAVRSRIGYMSQKFTLYDDLTIGENLEFYARLYGIPEPLAAKRRQWVLEVSDLAGKEGLLTAQLPGGWKQRVAFGAAIMHEPDLVFLDEPTSGVDPLARRAMWRMINELADTGAGVLVVTHYLEEAEQCSRIGFMAEGQLLVEGSPGEVRSRTGGKLIEVEPADAHRALSEFRRRFGAGAVTQFGSRLHVMCDDAGQCLARARRVLEEAGIGIVSAEEIPFSLEDVFLQMIRERSQAA